MVPRTVCQHGGEGVALPHGAARLLLDVRCLQYPVTGVRHGYASVACKCGNGCTDTDPQWPPGDILYVAKLAEVYRKQTIGVRHSCKCPDQGVPR